MKQLKDCTKIELIKLVEETATITDDFRKALTEAKENIEKHKYEINELRHPSAMVAISPDQALSTALSIIQSQREDVQNEIVGALIKELTKARKGQAAHTAEVARKSADNLRQFLVVASGHHYIDEVA